MIGPSYATGQARDHDDVLVEDVPDAVLPEPAEHAPGTRAEPAGASLRYRLRPTPALDGLRGVIIAAVVLFHAGVPHLDGAYLAITMFFTLSGFLITTLLLEEHLATGTIRMKEFWKRRARRLLPAVILLLVAVGFYARFVAEPIEAARLRGDALATMFYAANWHDIFAKQDYWDLFASPSLLQHMWSLAIEEQFYVVMPLVLGVLLWWTRGSLKAFLAFCLAVAVASAIWMAWIFDPSDASRAYLGTDTRVGGILLGTALAVWYQLKGPTTSPVRRVILEAAALVAAIVTLFSWATLDHDDPWVYRGGMFLCTVLGAVVIASLSHPRKGPLSDLLSWKPLCLLGVISYSLYLWHWPVIVILSQERVHLSGVVLVAIQVMVSLVLAILSFRYIENPIRRRGFRAWRYRPLVPIAATVALIAVVVLVSAPHEPATAEQQAAVAIQANDAAAIAQQANAPLALKTDDPIRVAAPDRVRPGQPLPRPTNRLPREMFVGDSVSLTLSMSMMAEPDRWKIEVANRSVVGCSVDADSGKTRSSGGAVRQEDPACQAWPSRWDRDLKQFRPDVVVFAFGGLQTDARLLDDGNWHKPCDPYFLQWYRGQLDEAFQLLTSQGAVLYALIPANVDLPSLYPDINEGFDCVRPVMREAAAANPNARIVNLDTWVCPTPSTCRDEESGYRLRFDGVHYGGQGASVANQWIQDQIFEPPPA